ncbi:MAG: hypothetical protein ACRETR_09620, partial [Steroidobacteraceae bacterium]
MNAAEEHSDMASGVRGGAGAVAREPSGWRWLPITLAVIGLDQLVKLWIVEHLALYRTLRVLPVLDVTLTYNRG